MSSDNAFSAYLEQPSTPTPARPQSKRSRRARRRREAEPQTIGQNPPTWPPPEPDDDLYDDTTVDDPFPPAVPPQPTDNDEDGFTGDWNDWTDQDSTPDDGAAAVRGEEVDWNDWATTTATEQSGDYVPTPTLPRLTDYGGGGKIARRPRKNFDDERYDQQRGRGRVLAAVGGVLAAVVVLVAIGLVATTFGVEDTSATDTTVATPSTTVGAGSTTVAATLPVWGLPGCEAFRSATITISAEPGDTRTAQGAILGFEHSYFVARDAAKVRSFVTADAHVGDQAALADGIAGLPADVRYCVHITRGHATDLSVWNVDLRQQWPGDVGIEKIAFTMRTTELTPGEHRITSITYR